MVNLLLQISSIIQGQLVQQQQVLQGLLLFWFLGFERIFGVLFFGVGGVVGFGMMFLFLFISFFRIVVFLGFFSFLFMFVGNMGMKKVFKKLEEIFLVFLEMVQMRKQCLDYYYQEMQVLKEVFKEYLIELFFL